MNQITSFGRFYLALIAITLVIVPGYLTAPSLDTAQFIAITAFALALPLLVCGLSSQVEPVKKPLTTADVIRGLIRLLAIFIDIIGLTAAFWHISWVIGTLFIVTSVIMFIVAPSLQSKTAYNNS